MVTVTSFIQSVENTTHAQAKKNKQKNPQSNSCQ